METKELEEALKNAELFFQSGNLERLKNIPEEFLKPKEDINEITGIVNKCIKKTFDKKCMYPGCTDDSIGSHSVQKALLSLVSKDNNVVEFSTVVQFKLNGSIKTNVDLINIKKASVFQGFCNQHDTKIFLPIETSDIEINNTEQQFLFLFRSLYKEFHDLRESFNLTREMWLKLSPILLRNESENEFQILYFLSEYYKTTCSYKWLENLKSEIDDDYKNKNFCNTYKFDCLELNDFIPVFGTTFFDVQAAREDLFYEKNIVYDLPLYFSMTLLPNKNKDKLLLFYAYRKDQEKELKPFINRISNTNINELKLFISDTILRNSSNFYIGPDYWNRFSKETKDKIIFFFDKTIRDKKFDTSFGINLWQ